VWEFSRMNMSGNVLSKRKILKLVATGTVRGWDDPRLLTLNGIRRRGITADAINTFCREVGVTRKEQVVMPEKLEACARTDLDVRANRAFCVLEPLEVELSNLSADAEHTMEAPWHPKLPERGTRLMRLRRRLWIESSDFREEDAKG